MDREANSNRQVSTSRHHVYSHLSICTREHQNSKPLLALG
jgi:hypothetical protein